VTTDATNSNSSPPVAQHVFVSSESDLFPQQKPPKL
jgi:hypothetical protein